MSVLEYVDFGRTVLESLGYTVRGNKVFLVTQDGEEEVEVDGKTLVLPDDSFLRAPKWTTEIPFAPLGENPQRGESEVVKLILESVVANLNVSLLGVLIHLYTNVASMPDTKGLTTEQSELLSFVTNVNVRVKKAIVNMVNTVTMEDQNSSLLTCNLRRRCPLGNEKFERVCVVRFPFADTDRKDKPYGLSTNAEMDTLRGLLDYILPGWEVDDTYSVGTNSFVAPYFSSIMLMYSKMGSRLNQVIDMFKDVSPSLVSYQSTGAEKVLELLTTPGHMERLRDAIPPLEGNKGSTEANRQPPGDYKIDQPKPAVDLPWNESVDGQAKATASQAPVTDDPSDTGGAYVPGRVNPQQSVQPPMPYNHAPLGSGPTYDPNSFHGRRLAKQALMQPLGMQNQVTGVGSSPFLESNDQSGNGSAYRPGALREAQQRTAAQRQGHRPNIHPSNLGF